MLFLNYKRTECRSNYVEHDKVKGTQYMQYMSCGCFRVQNSLRVSLLAIFKIFAIFPFFRWLQFNIFLIFFKSLLCYCRAGLLSSPDRLASVIRFSFIVHLSVKSHFSDTIKWINAPACIQAIMACSFLRRKMFYFLSFSFNMGRQIQKTTFLNLHCRSPPPPEKRFL